MQTSGAHAYLGILCSMQIKLNTAAFRGTAEFSGVLTNNAVRHEILQAAENRGPVLSLAIKLALVSC